MKGYKNACRIRQTANGDWLVSPPAGKRLYIEGDTRIHERLSFHRRPDIQARNCIAGHPWISRVTLVNNNWAAIAWSPELGLFAAVGITGGNNRAMTSPDGINWTVRNTPVDNTWYGIAWSPELGLFAAVATTGTNDRVMTSPDGINWTIRVTPADNSWYGIAWSSELGLFVVVAASGTDDRVMTSPDGIDWTIRVTPEDNNWYGIAWSPELGLFAAVAFTGTNDRVMTSPDGINWTIRVTPADNNWQAIVWSPELGLFVAVSTTGTNDRAMTSPDGINWTIRVTPTDNGWLGITWSPELGLFAAVSLSGTNNRAMTSPDGINWTIRVVPVDNDWYGIAWSPELGLFAAISTTGTNDRVMTSADSLGRVQVNEDDDWELLPPAGQIVRVGRAIGGFSPPATNNDMLVSGRLAAYEQVCAGAEFESQFLSEVVGAGGLELFGIEHGEAISLRMLSEEITIGVGNGLAGVVSVANMFQVSSIIEMIYARVTQAPGGGATWFSVHRTGAPGVEFIFQSGVALGTLTDSMKDNDGTLDGPSFNDTTATLTIYTDADVTVSDMKVRIGILHRQLWGFDD